MPANHSRTLVAGLLLSATWAAGPARASSKPAAAPAEKDAAPADADAAAQAESREISNSYVHRWLPMPSFTAEGLGENAGPMSVAPRPGRMTVVLFLASYCEPCQQMMEDYLRLEKKYRRLSTDFVYVFAHDTKDDAQGYMKEFDMTRGVLANFDALKAYHNPKLPTVYVGDRHGWLMTRFEEAKGQDLARLDELLKRLTAF